MSDASQDGDGPLLRVENLRTRFRTESGTVTAVDGISFDVARGETVCLVGESGSGKTVASESITRLIKDGSSGGTVVDGSVRFDGRDLLSLSEPELRAVRGGRIAHVFQHPQGTLNPVYTIGWQLIESIRLHTDASKAAARARAVDLLDRVGLPDPAARIDEYPHELSGGQQQRVALAMALAGEPDLLIADEPTTALDVTIQSQVLRLLESVQAEFGMGLLLVTHDLGVVASLADRAVVLYAGTVMERGDVFDLFDRPSHPYTRRLFESIPGRVSVPDRAGLERGASDSAAPSADAPPPDPTAPPDGCRFRDRCPHAVDACESGDHPPLYVVSGTGDDTEPPVSGTGDDTGPSDGDERDHVASCVHFAPGGNPDVVYGSGSDGDHGDGAVARRATDEGGETE